MPFITLGGGAHSNLVDVTVAQHHQDLPGLFTTDGDIIARDNVGAIIRRPQVSQGQTEAGTDAVTRGYTALRVAQAIAVQAPNIATGSYTGDGALSQAITGIGFQPKWLHIAERNITDNTSTGNESHQFTSDVIIDDVAGGAAMRDVAASSPTVGGNTVVSLDADGFTVDDDGANSHPNESGTVYNFMAMA